MLANKEFKIEPRTEALKAELLILVREDKIYPMCPGCDHSLSFGEYLNLFCQRCGDISIWENDKILFYPKDVVG